MASFFRSFGSSNMSKRLLRYALSRLEFLDTDALDVDKLDLEWGRNNVLTFQDVGIKLEACASPFKLEHLLQLPASFKLQKAKVLKLRVTIPSAIYSSPIVVEVDGVQVKLRAGAEESPRDEQTRGRGRTSKSKQGEDELVPHAIDLAQSFLDTQPLKEKAELQAALDAESHDLAASVSSTGTSEDESDEDVPVGTGQPLSLPVFLADFLQGIVDRTQVSIRGVTFELDVEVPVEVHSTTPELVTFQLAIDDLNVEGVTTQLQPIDGEDATAEYRDGKRRISLNKIRASLISEANVFSTLARTPSMPSSVATGSPVMTARQPPSQNDDPLSHSIYEPMNESTDLSQSQYFPMMDSEDAFDIPYEFNSSQDEDPVEEDLRSAPSTPRALAPQNSPPLESPQHPAQSAVMPPPDPWSAFERDARSESALQQQRDWNPESDQPMASLENKAASHGSVSPLSDDLAQSHLFSHEEAESMYMSAFSNTGESQRSSAMPGAWDDYEPPSLENSPQHERAEKLHPSDPHSALESDTERRSPPSPVGELSSPGRASSPFSGRGEQEDEVQNRDGYFGTTDVPPDSAAEGIATPRGPTRFVKEIISLAGISIYVPSTHNHSPIPASPTDVASSSHYGLDRSVAPNVPGAFSVYGTTSTTAPHRGPALAASRVSHGQPQGSDIPKDDCIEVVLAPVDVRFDASISFLLVMVTSRILTLLKEHGNEKTPKSTSSSQAPSTQASSPQPDIKILAKHISIQFLESLVGVADTSERVLNPNSAAFGTDALLMSTLENLKVHVTRTDKATKTSVDLEKFRFGYGNDDILSFDQRLQMRASVRDAFPSAGADVSLKITQTAEATRCEVQTLPLHVKLDCQRLDETFSWFGGLSSFLNMGSSMTSNASPVPKSPTRTVKKARGVRFDAPIKTDDKSAAQDNKVNVRIGGFHLDLIGKECSVALDTSAVKLVTRDEGLGIGITKIQLAGPYLRRSIGDPPIKATIMNTRIEYLFSPTDNDLERLLELIIPSKNKFDEADDEIMVDTLLRQRRKGAVVRLNLDSVEIGVKNIPQLQCLSGLGEEVARLGTVAKYLPEDDKPGLLTLAMIRNCDVSVAIDKRFGRIQTSLKDVEAGHITFPSLVAVACGAASVHRNDTEELLGSAVGIKNSGPVFTMRMIPDAMEPVIKLRMRNINVEYRVPTIIDVLDLAEDATPQDFEAQLAASVANLGEQAHTAITGRSHATDYDKGKANAGKPTKLDIVFRDCLIGLNPLNLRSKLVFALTDAQLKVSLSNSEKAEAGFNLNKGSVLLTDNVEALGSLAHSSRRRPSTSSSEQIIDLCSKGFVDICFISAAKVNVLVGANDDGSKFVDVEVRDDLLVMETCADSTQTLIATANALQPPMPESKAPKYQTNIMPIEDLLSSISADAFGTAEGTYDFDDDFALAQELGGEDLESVEDLEGVDLGEESHSSSLNVHSQFYDENREGQADDLADSVLSGNTSSQDTSDGVLLTFNTDADDSDLVVHDDYFGTQSVIHGYAPKWNSTANRYEQPKDTKSARYPMTVRVRDVHFIWNLFDGYDWTHTREVITKAVEDVEAKAFERERRGRSDRVHVTADMEAMIEEEETVIGDFLFNSIYIGVPANRDPRELTRNINEALNDNATETESVATTAMTATPSRMGSKRTTKKRLKLERSKRHKVTFELRGINVDMANFPENSGETQSSIDVKVRDLDVFDHVPTSTWKKFATYDQDAGEREMNTSMAHIELLKVKPLQKLAATELVMKVTLLPLRLHVDQDALDFITRFFEFKDPDAPAHASEADQPFVQRAEIMSIPVKLDFKPKRVDYAGLRSGHTTEFMNFLILDEARMTLRHTIIYGVSGFERLGKTLNDIWMPEVKRNQLPGILAGLAPVRSIVNVGSGFKDLIEIPIKEYKKDGKLVRSIGKGAAAFAKTTGTEIVKLGAKMAVGTQYVLQGAEGILVKPDQQEMDREDEEVDNENTRQISLYADQPTGVVQGLRGAYSSLTRDLNVARDAIIAIPGAVQQSGSAQDAAKAVLRQAPTIIFRPLIGSSRAIGQTLMGATNSLDPHNRRRIDEKYKRN